MYRPLQRRSLGSLVSHTQPERFDLLVTLDQVFKSSVVGEGVRTPWPEQPVVVEASWLPTHTHAQGYPSWLSTFLSLLCSLSQICTEQAAWVRCCAKRRKAAEDEPCVLSEDGEGAVLSQGQV